MGKFVTLMRNALGLNVRSDPTRLVVAAKKDGRDGMTELAAAVNVDVERDGRISRRTGQTQKRSEASSSIFCDGGDCLFVSNGGLYRLNADYSRTLLRSGLHESARMSYVEVAGTIYYANGYQRGYVPRGGTHNDWVAYDYVGPTTSKSFHDPPTGHLLGFFGGSLLVAVGSTIFHSHPFAYSWFRRNGYYLPESHRITMIRPVPDGLFVGTTEEVFFYGGNDIRALQRRKVADCGVIEGSDLVVRASLVGTENFGPEAIIWASTEGLFVGAPSGFIQNVTEDRLTYPSAAYAAAGLKDQSYLVLIQD